jgi:hypothetical protein
MNPQESLGQPVPRGGINFSVILIIFLGIGVLLFGTFAIVEYNAAAKAKADQDQAKAQSYKQGQTDQKATDALLAQKQAESPFRSYKAPDLLGGFEIKFPKNWNAYAVEDDNGSPQLDLLLHPDFVVKVAGGKANFYAAHIQLLRQTSVELNKQYTDKIEQGKKGSVSEVTVSGIKASQYRGKLDNQNDSIAVLVPVRDKTIIIATEDLRYEPELKQILAQANIVP